MSDTTTTTKFCKDCVFAKRHISDFILFWGSYQFAKCTHPSSLKETSDFHITGKTSLSDYYFCSTQRAYECGKQARHFQSKE